MLIGQLLLAQTQENLLALDKNKAKLGENGENVFSILLNILKQTGEFFPEKEKTVETVLGEQVATLSAQEMLENFFPQSTPNLSPQDTKVQTNWQQISPKLNLNNGLLLESIPQDSAEITQVDSRSNLSNKEIVTKQEINVLPENLNTKIADQEVNNKLLLVIDKFINKKQVDNKFMETSDEIYKKITSELKNNVAKNLSSRSEQVQRLGQEKISEPFSPAGNNNLNQEANVVEIIKKPLVKEVSAELSSKADSSELNTFFTIKKPAIYNTNYFNSNDSKNFSSFFSNLYANKSLNNSETALPVRELPEFILKQLKTRIMTNKMENTSEISLRLQPEELGKLNLKLSYSEGQVSVKILTENSQVRELVEHNLLQLRESLNNQGIKCSTIDVQVRSDGSFQQYFGQSSNPFNQTPNYYKVKRGYQKLDDEMVVEDTKELLDNTNLQKSGLSNLEILA